MENEKRLSEDELISPPGEGPEEQNFAIQKERSYTDEVISSKLDEIKKQKKFEELERQRRALSKELEHRKKLESIQAKIDGWCQLAEQNLRKMTDESCIFKSSLNRFLPKKIFGLTWSWKDIALFYPGHCYGIKVRLDKEYILKFKSHYSSLTPTKNIADLHLGLETDYWDDVGNEIINFLKVLADPKKTIDYFVERNWLKVE